MLAGAVEIAAIEATLMDSRFCRFGRANGKWMSVATGPSDLLNKYERWKLCVLWRRLLIALL